MDSKMHSKTAHMHFAADRERVTGRQFGLCVENRRRKAHAFISSISRSTPPLYCKKHALRAVRHYWSIIYHLPLCCNRSTAYLDTLSKLPDKMIIDMRTAEQKNVYGRRSG